MRLISGGRSDRLACLADLLPTLLARAGIALPDGAIFDGLDLLGDATRDRLIGECVGYHAVLERDWTYHWTERGGSELLFQRGTDEELRPAEAPEERTRLRSILGAELAARGHQAAGLNPTMETLSQREARIRRWPGFHSIYDDTCDLLH